MQIQDGSTISKTEKINYSYFKYAYEHIQIKILILQADSVLWIIHFYAQ